MRDLLSLLFVLALISVASGQFSRVSLPSDEKFSSDARIEYTEGPGSKSYVVGKKNGVEYRYFLDDVRGIIEGTKGYGTDSVLGPSDPKNWRFGCHLVGNAGQKDCVFSREGIAMITYIKDGRAGTWIANTNFSTDDPDLVFADIVRVDGVEIYNSRNKQFSTEALSVMRSGKVLTLLRGPDPKNVTTYDLYGFNTALELSEWAIKHVY